MSLREAFGPSDYEKALARSQELRAEKEAATPTAIAELRGEVARLEGLLDVAGDIDQNAAGDSRQSLYRPIARGVALETSRDFNDQQRRRIIGLSHMVYGLRGHGENLVDAHVDFMIGDQLTPKAKDGDEELQEALDDIWTDPRSRLADDHEQLTTSFLLDGELAFRAEVSALDGHAELAWIDPLLIEYVRQDVRGFDAFLEVTTDRPGETDRLFVLNNLTEEITIEPLSSPTKKEGYRFRIVETSINDAGLRTLTRSEGVHGLAFFGAWNRPKGATRGRGELASVLDQIDLHDELVFSTAEVQNLKRWFLMHVKDPSVMSPAAGRKKLKEMGLQTPPRNPKVLITNNNVEVDIKSNLGDRVSEKWLAEELGVIIMGAKGMPELWRGTMGDANLAGARAADYLPLRRLRRKQRRLIRYWTKLLEVSLELKKRAGVISEEVASGDFEIVTMEVGGKDKERAGELFKSITAAIVQAETAGIGIKPELLHALAIGAAKELGFEIPTGADEFDQAAIDKQEEDAKINAQLRQVMSQKDKSSEGDMDEEDRDRQEEGAA